MQTLRLARAEWEFDELAPLGPPGGFGEVFRGSGVTGAVAIKRLKLTAGEAAFRELKIGEVLGSRELDHVVPILDWGQDADSDRYFLVMPICQQSLQNKIKTASPLAVPELCKIALEIIAGLCEVDDLVHRDLKPGNVLLLDGRWRLADFGIAKFVEDSTSLETLRGNLTPAYGAPEQWLNERPTHAADVYALGCIVYEMATGKQMFSGTLVEVREAHLHKAPDIMFHPNQRLSTFIGQMLRKSPMARPTLSRCEAVFKDIASGNSDQAYPALVRAAAIVGESSAAADAATRAEESRRREREILIKESKLEMEQIRNKLYNTILERSEEASLKNDVLHFGAGSLGIGTIQLMYIRSGGKENRPRSGWDVCTYCNIYVERNPRTSYSGGDPPYIWSASLVYARTPADQSYRWREVSFYRTLGTLSTANEPFSLDASSDEFEVALSKVLGIVSVAFGPKPIDAEDEESFRRRWTILISKAATGSLDRPNAMPIPEDYFKDS